MDKRNHYSAIVDLNSISVRLNRDIDSSYDDKGCNLLPHQNYIPFARIFKNYNFHSHKVQVCFFITS